MPQPDPAAVDSVTPSPHPALRADLLTSGEVNPAKDGGVKAAKEQFFYGGQAVIEGVMMRGKSHYAVAIRLPKLNPDTLLGEIVVNRGELAAPIYTNRIWKLPFIRGLALIGEQLHLGMKSLIWSANMNAGVKD